MFLCLNGLQLAMAILADHMVRMFKTCFVLNSFKHDKNRHFVQLVLVQLIFLEFLKSQVILGNLAEDIRKIVDAFLALIPSSASLDRIFSTLGFVHDETLNRLPIEKANNLAFCLGLLQ